MSACRSSRQFVRRAQKAFTCSTPCPRNLLSPSLRTFHTSLPRRNEQPTNTTDSDLKDLVPELPPTTELSKAPALRRRADIAAEQKLLERADEINSVKRHFRPYTKDELDAMADYYTEEQMEALKAAEKAVDLDDLAVQWGPRLDQWKVDYLDDLSAVDPLVDGKTHLNLSDGPQLRHRKWEDIAEHITSSALFNGLSLVEMLYLIEKRRFVPEKVLAGLRTLHVFKGTHKEFAAKRILWRFLPQSGKQSKEDMISLVSDERTGKASVAFLFEVLDALPMDEIKKHELLAMKHWTGTPKEEALRPQLERVIAEHGGITDKIFEEALMERLANLRVKELGYNPANLPNTVDEGEPEVDDWMIDLPHREIYDRDIFYNAVQTPIPKFKDPRVRYDHEAAEDANGAAYKKLSHRLNVDLDYLKRLRCRVLIMHRVVNQTRIGKIQSFYCLSIAGNDNGLVGIGEGKSAETVDAMLQSRMAALRNMQPINRYERRTIYGTQEAKVGGTTVKLFARPPGFGLRTQFLIYEIARACGIRDLSARVGRSRNKMNTVKATLKCLLGQKLPEDIARARGRKIVDVRKVYYGRTVY
ncbi:hypothetical protein BT63DRAFT_480261 [Microthyrium microscopicum]|uniref:Small ribosomal subunit protein uS5m n=1 Tax=Microthyrium microscopicum TaxID=703497 RepID=A0A6A6U4N9_9PEZI|nr:hypothetical protein BT63DRAFT_480261 [Microthyrium microscopicum]